MPCLAGFSPGTHGTLLPSSFQIGSLVSCLLKTPLKHIVISKAKTHKWICDRKRLHQELGAGAASVFAATFPKHPEHFNCSSVPAVKLVCDQREQASVCTGLEL